jgi:hypothetical protein
MISRPLRASMSTIKISKCSTALCYYLELIVPAVLRLTYLLLAAVQICVDKRDDILGAEGNNEPRTFRKQSRSTTLEPSVVVCWSTLLFRSRDVPGSDLAF